jgi:hypothetical protein
MHAITPYIKITLLDVLGWVCKNASKFGKLLGYLYIYIYDVLK